MLKRQKGQGLVEFALLAPVLLLVILAIIETALIFQGYLTVQHAAREAARWAVTYNPERGWIDADTPCDGVTADEHGIVCSPNETEEDYWRRRAELIKWHAVESAVGLRFDRDNPSITPDDFKTNASEDNFFGVQVWGFSSFEEPEGGWDSEVPWYDSANGLMDHPGLPGLSVRVQVAHNVKLLDPLFSAIVPQVRVVAQVEMINEGTQAGFGNVAPPILPPPPVLPTVEWGEELTKTPGEEIDETHTPTPITPSATSSGTSTPVGTPPHTPTATPTGPFITVSNYVVTPTQAILIDVNQHPVGFGAFELRWIDSNEALVEVISSTVTVDDSGFKLNIPYNVPSVQAGIYYVETQLFGNFIARSAPITVVPPAPDLVVTHIGWTEPITPNLETTMTVEVANLTAGYVSGFFDVDLYIDPPYPPITNRPGNSKQWIEDIGPFETQVVTHVVTLYGGGMHEVWAQVDTSDWVAEQNETNNIFGPESVRAGAILCSEQSDHFDDPVVDPKWSEVQWNASTHDQYIEEIDGESTLTVRTSGSRIGSSSDRATFFYQAFTGDFVATLKINSAPTSNSNARIGLMVRASLNDNSPMVAMTKLRDSGLQFQYRTTAGGSTSSSSVASGVPTWVRFIRMGTGISVFYSYDGTNWTAGGLSTKGTNIPTLPATVYVGIAGASYTTSGSSTGNVDDFDLCPVVGDFDTCVDFSDDFEADSTTTWSDADIGSTLPGSSNKSGGTMTVVGNGSTLWSSDNFHYTYQQVSGNFLATLKINWGPDLAAYSSGGLMVRDNLSTDSADVIAVKSRSYGLRFGYRAENGGGGLSSYASNTNNGALPQWVRMVRSGDTIATYYSLDGASWTYAGSATADLGEDVYIGMAVSSYSSSSTDDANFDDFLFCPGEAGDEIPPVIPPEELPPGFQECVQTIELGNFEASDITPPWERNVDTFHASDKVHAGNFALQFRASTGPRPEYRKLLPWAYQADIAVPGGTLPTTEGTLTYWQFVKPEPEGSTPDPDDHFYLAIRNSGGVTITEGIPLANGDTSTPIYMQNVVSVETFLPGNGFADLAEQNIQVYFYADHDNVAPGTYFYIDDVRFDICTMQPIPEDVPGTASIGGLIEVLLGQRPTLMPGIQVWAYAAGGEIYRTQTIHDSTYHFYNVPPGTYTLYAEVWIADVLYTGTTEVTVVADERNYGVDMLLQ